MQFLKINKNIVSFFLLLVFILSCNISKFVKAEENTEGAENSKPKLERHFVFDAIPMNLKEIVDAADRIFVGKCINVEEIEDDSESKLPVIKYTMKITEGIRGVGNKETITFKQWQPTVRGASYDVGKKYILFLYPDSKRSLTSPVGFSQGQFDVEKKGIIRRKEVVHNKLNNRGLNRNLKTQKKISIDNDKYINDYVHRYSELGIPMRYQEFIKAVRYLAEN